MPATGKTGGIYCQRCRAANALDQEFCARCGTRLMLVVEPSALRFEEDSVVAADYDEHLLERISALENRLARLGEKLERGVELLSRSARSAYFDHLLLETLIGALAEARVVSERTIKRRWRERFDTEVAETAEAERRTSISAEVIARYGGPERTLFARLAGDGFALVGEGREAEGVRSLEKAAALAPDNAPLNSFVGEYYFRKGKAALARDYLARALAAAPGDPRVCLLLGLLYGEQGEAARSRELLREALRAGLGTFAARYALGRLSAAEADWEAALSEFKLALAARDCPEAHYTLGLVYYQTGRFRTALRHVSKALDRDEGYADALYLLGLIRLRLGEKKKAAEVFAVVRRAAGVKARRGKAPGKGLRPDDMPPPPLLGAPRAGRKRLLSGGDKRIAAVISADALDALGSK